jgi:CubicO group peptidase (beta-lactamase class C family)
VFDPDAGFDLPDGTFWMIGHDGQHTAVIASKRLAVVGMVLTPSNPGCKPQALARVAAGAAEQSGAFWQDKPPPCHARFRVWPLSSSVRLR